LETNYFFAAGFLAGAFLVFVTFLAAVIFAAGLFFSLKALRSCAMIHF